MTTPAHGTRCARVFFWSVGYDWLASSFRLAFFPLVASLGLIPSLVSAQNCPLTIHDTDADEGMAYAHCESSRAAQIACRPGYAASTQYFICDFLPITSGTFSGGGQFNLASRSKSSDGLVAILDVHKYMGDKECSDRSDTTSSFPFVNAGFTCSSGCQEIHLNLGDGVTHGHSTGNRCKEDDPCPAGTFAFQPPGQTFKQCIPPPPDRDGDGSSDDDDDFPDDPTESRDTDHDGVGDHRDQFPDNPGEDTDNDHDGTGNNGDFSPDNPDNGRDTGSGNESDNVSSGGGNCSTPPSSSGDAILAQIAYQTWATRCVIQSSSGAPAGSPGGSPGSGSGSGSGSGDLTWHDGAQPDFGRSGDGDGNSAFSSDDELLAGIDSSGFGLSRACPNIPTPSFSGHPIELPVDLLCDAFAVLSAFILLGGFVQAAYIIGRG